MPTCRFCQAPIIWIPTKNGKNMPAEVPSIMRNGSEPPPKGKYIDMDGNLYEAADVPCKLEVWRTHWSQCPGAKEARKI